MKFLSFHALFLGMLFSTVSLASIETTMSDSPFGITELDLQRQAVLKSIDSTKKDIQLKTRMFHTLKSGASSPLYAWESEAVIEKKRKNILPYLKIEIREKLKRLASLENQLEELQYDLDLARATPHGELDFKKSILGSTDVPFLCQSLPADPLTQQMTLTQGFGAHTDTESGLKWKSSGWWVTHISGPIKSCSQGVIVFDDKIQGRGRVVMVDHGHSILTLYANLSEENAIFESEKSLTTTKRFKKGDKIEAGSILGTAKEKFYFEVRKSGVPMDPKVALRSEQIEKLKF